MDPPECEIIQSGDFAAPDSTPLILIHDGGGTTFGYHCLEPLRRPVFGIANPRFHSGEPWQGGLEEMAQLYAGMVRATVASPDFPRTSRETSSRAGIFLGGWSFGGLLALQVAWLLRDDEGVEIVGLLLVDTPYPVGVNETAVKVEAIKTEDEPASENLMLARRAMAAAREMIVAWTMPDWRQEDRSPPPAVLVKAGSHVSEEGQEAPVDRFRAYARLGWDDWEGHRLVQEVVVVDGHHYDMFDFARAAGTTLGVKAACAALERIRERNRKKI